MFSRSIVTFCLSFSLAACVAERGEPAQVQDGSRVSLQIQQDESPEASAEDSEDGRAKRLTETVFIDGPQGPVAGARVAIRDADGRPWWTTKSDANGWLDVQIPPDAYVTASAPGFAPAGRQGAGTLKLKKSADVGENAQVRFEGERPVWEVVSGNADVPLAAGLRNFTVQDTAAIVLPAAPPHFIDTAGHPAALHIASLRSRDIIAGDPNGRFRPDDAVTRAEAVTVLLRALKLPLQSYQGDFRDVENDAWYAKAVGTAAALGLVSGYPDGSFRPAAEVKRAEMAALLHKVAKLEETGPARGVTVPVDLRRSHWAYETILRLQAWCGALDANHNTIRPNEAATRAELIVATSRVLACQTDRAPVATDPVADAAADKAWATFERHHQTRAETGIGTHYGDTSEFHEMSLEEKQDFLAEHVKEGLNPPSPESLTRSSCVEYTMELAEAGFTGNEGQVAWEEVDADTRADQLRGTTLTKKLVEKGWHAYLYIDDPEYRGITSEDGEHQYALAQAERAGEYYGTPLQGVFVANTELHRKSMGALKFGVFVLRGGTHVAAIADGAVHELARSEGPNKHVLYNDLWVDIIDIYTQYVFEGGEEGEHSARRLWHSGVIVIPPGTQLPGARDL